MYIDIESTSVQDSSLFLEGGDGQFIGEVHYLCMGPAASEDSVKKANFRQIFKEKIRYY